MIHRRDCSQTCARLAVILSLSLIALGCGSGTSSATKVVFNPKNPAGAGPAPVVLSSSGSVVGASNLGAAGNYVILAKTGVSSIPGPGATVTGNIGVSPAAASYITGFPLVADATNVFSTTSDSSVVGKIYAANYAVPTPSNLTTAIGSMETAYLDAASRNPPDFNELATGNLGGLTLSAGLYTWTTSITVQSDVTLSGGANDVWIFQTAGDLMVSNAKHLILGGSAQAKNIYWQVAGKVVLGNSSHFEGIILSKTAIILQNGASLNGRALSQTAVTLDQNSVTEK